MTNVPSALLPPQGILQLSHQVPCCLKSLWWLTGARWTSQVRQEAVHLHGPIRQPWRPRAARLMSLGNGANVAEELNFYFCLISINLNFRGYHTGRHRYRPSPNLNLSFDFISQHVLSYLTYRGLFIARLATGCVLRGLSSPPPASPLPIHKHPDSQRGIVFQLLMSMQ